MKIIIGILAMLLIAGIGVWIINRTSDAEKNAQRNEPEAQPQEGASPDVGTYQIDSEQSAVRWTAEKPSIIGYTHYGTFSVKEGEVTVGEQRSSGTIVLDMTKLKVESLGGGKAGNESRLETHLKSGDFFEVDTYPEARLEITNISEADQEGRYTVTGNLTIKDTTEEIQFPAVITQTDETVRIEADFEIDRTKWNITFGSASFFDSLADNAIADMVQIELRLVAR